MAIGLESKGLKVNISKTKVMRCAWDSAPKEAAADPCSVCGKRVGVNSIHCATCGYWVHGQCSRVRGSLERVAQGLCAKCVELEEERQLMSFASKMSSLNVFAYLSDMLNDTGGMEQAVVARVRAAWMKFRELGRILCIRGISLRMKCITHVFAAC